MRRSDKRVSDLNRGFTLVELLVVLVILAIVAAIGIPALLGFIDKGKESEYKAHAEAALAATQTALTEIYNDAGNSFTPTKRNKVKALAGAADGTAFTVWTEKVLWDGKTKALEDNIGSYIIVKAIYKENDNAYMYYDGTNWTKYDSEIDAKIAAVGEAPGSTGDNKLNNELGNNVIFVWPYKRDFAYLNGTSDPLTQRSDVDDPNIKIVTFETDPAYSGVYYFHRIGKGVSTGKDSVKVVFWKENNIIKSSWDDVEGIYEESQDYKYKFIPDKDGVKFLGWKPSQDAGYSYTKSEEVGNYIFGEGQGTDPNGTPINEFTFYASLERDDDFAEDSIVSRKLSDLIKSSGQKITSFSRVTMDSMGSGVTATAIEEPGYTPIYAWIEGSTVKWCSKAPEVYMPEICSGFFADNNNLAEFTFGGFNPGRITDMSNMFSGCKGLLTADIDSETGTLTAASGMFNGCSSLTSVTMSSNFKSENVTSFDNMFKGCSNLDSAEFSFDTSSSQSFKNMFNGCGKVKELDLSSFDTSSLTGDGLNGIFSGCNSLETLNMSGWNMEGLTSLDDVFNGLTALATLDMGEGWNLSNCASLNRTFKDCKSLSEITISKLGLSPSNLKSMSETFAGCTSFSKIDFSGFTFKSVTDVSGLLNMGSESSSLARVTFDNKTDTSSVTNMSNMFAGCNAIKNLDLTKFDTRSVNDFTGMFNDMTNVETITVSIRFVVPESSGIMFNNDTKISGGKTSFESTDGDTSARYAKIDGWKKQDGYFKGHYNDATISKTLFSSVFNSRTEDVVWVTGDYSEEELDVLNAKRVDDGMSDYQIYAWREGTTVKWWTNADRAFMPEVCDGFFKKNTNLVKFDFSGFYMSKVVSIQEMFNECTNLQTVVFGEETDTSNLESMRYAFYKCGQLKTLDLSTWDTTSLMDMEYTFDTCTALEYINFGEDGWTIDNPVNLHNTFTRCKKINQKFDNFHVSNATHVGSLFKECNSLTEVDVSNIGVANSSVMEQVFFNCNNLQVVNLGSWNTSNATMLNAFFSGCKKLTTIYADAFTVKSGCKVTDIFKECQKLKGGNGTAWISNYTSKAEYARIDGKNDLQGLFTDPSLYPGN